MINVSRKLHRPNSLNFITFENYFHRHFTALWGFFTSYKIKMWRFTECFKYPSLLLFFPENLFLNYIVLRCFSSQHFWHWTWDFFHHTNQFSNSSDTPWLLYNSLQVWHYLPRVSEDPTGSGLTPTDGLHPRVQSHVPDAFMLTDRL